jgi:two-component system, chemotaxis family, sensor kinase CheA
MSSRAARNMREFLREADEIVRALQGNLVLLHDAASDPRILDDTFRMVHTLKGIAEPFRRVRIGEVAHLLESLLDGMRLGRRAATDEVRGLLDEAVAVCRAELTAASGGPRMELEGFVDFLERLQQAAAAPGPGDEELALPGVPLAGLTEYQEHRARDNLRRGRGLYKVTVAFPLLEARDGLLRLGEATGPVGEVIAHIPLAAHDDDTLAFEVLVAAADIDEVVERLAPLGAGAVSELAPARPPAQAAPAMPSDADGEPGPAVRVPLDELQAMLAEVAAASALVTGDPARARLAALEARLEALCTTPLGPIFDKLRRIARAIVTSEGLEAEVVVSGDQLRIDRGAADDLADALLHAIRNALDHGIEPADQRAAAGKPARGRVELCAADDGDRIRVTVRDDGRGIDPEAVARAVIRRKLAPPEQVEALDDAGKLRLVLLPGMSTRDQVSELSGRGVGMDVVKESIERLGGAVEIESRLGAGTRVILSIPRHRRAGEPAEQSR